MAVEAGWLVVVVLQMFSGPVCSWAGWDVVEAAVVDSAAASVAAGLVVVDSVDLAAGGLVVGVHAAVGKATWAYSG